MRDLTIDLFSFHIFRRNWSHEGCNFFVDILGTPSDHLHTKSIMTQFFPSLFLFVMDYLFKRPFTVVKLLRDVSFCSTGCRKKKRYDFEMLSFIHSSYLWKFKANTITSTLNRCFFCT